MSYADKPRPCSCFNGYCYRSLCAEKVVEKQRKADLIKVDKKPTRKRTEILVRRWEGSDGNG